MNEFLIIVQGNGNAVEQAPEAIQSRIDAYQAWAGSVGERYVDGQRLEPTWKHLSMKNGTKTVKSDGPYLETKEIIAGFVRIKAQNFDEAAAIASSCPLLEDWDLIIRQIV